MQVVPRTLLPKGRVFSAVNVTDFMHLYGQGNRASFFVEMNQSIGTTKEMQKRIHVSAIQFRFVHARTNAKGT